jgi:1-acyl-sn-glycerol-3-phosphate acyltransferase
MRIHRKSSKYYGRFSPCSVRNKCHILLHGSDHADSVIPKGTRVMSKKSLKYMPFFGQFLQAGGAVFVDRGNSAVAVQSLQAAGEEIKKHHTSIWVFPEGTCTSRPYHDLRPFKKGAFHVAVQAGLPVVPVVFENHWNMYHKGIFNAGTLKVRGVKGSSCVREHLLVFTLSNLQCSHRFQQTV